MVHLAREHLGNLYLYPQLKLRDIKHDIYLHMEDKRGGANCDFIRGHPPSGHCQSLSDSSLDSHKASRLSGANHSAVNGPAGTSSGEGSD